MVSVDKKLEQLKYSYRTKQIIDQKTTHYLNRILNDVAVEVERIRIFGNR